MSNGNAMKKILVIDDNSTIVEQIKYAINLQGIYHVIVAYDGVQGLERIYAEQPDCVIVDVKMPRMDGYQVVRCLRDDPRTADIPLIILSAMTREEDQMTGLLTGADDYITKPFRPALLEARVNAVLRRGGGWSKADGKRAVRYAGIELDRDARLAYRDHIPLILTAKEFDLLFFFLQHPRQVLTRDTIIEHVWGFDYEGESENIVDVYVGYLRKKLEEYGPRLIHTERGVGFVLKELKTGK